MFEARLRVLLRSAKGCVTLMLIYLPFFSVEVVMRDNQVSSESDGGAVSGLRYSVW